MFKTKNKTDLFATLGGKEHRHVSAFQLSSLIQGCHFGALLSKAFQQVTADFRVSHFTAAETNGYLHAIAIGNELLCIFELGVEVTDVDTGRHADLLDLHNVLILLCFFLALTLLELVLTIVHKLANGRNSLRRNLHQVNALFIGDIQRFCSRHDTQLLAVGTDEAHFLISDFLVQLMHYVTNSRSTSIPKITKRECTKHPRNDKLPPQVGEEMNRVNLFAELEVRQMLSTFFVLLDYYSNTTAPCQHLFQTFLNFFYGIFP